MIAENMQAQEVRRSGFRAGSGDDTENVLWTNVSTLFEELFGHVDHLLGGVGFLASDRVNAPQQVHTVDDGFDTR